MAPRKSRKIDLGSNTDQLRQGEPWREPEPMPLQEDGNESAYEREIKRLDAAMVERIF